MAWRLLGRGQPFALKGVVFIKPSSRPAHVDVINSLPSSR